MLLLLCRGVIFLNATPFWSFMPHPETAPRLVTAILPWNGTLPVPRLARFLVKNLWWNLLSRRRILQALVRNVYADKYVSISLMLLDMINSKQQKQSAYRLAVSMYHGARLPIVLIGFCDMASRHVHASCLAITMLPCKVADDLIAQGVRSRIKQEEVVTEQ